MTRISDMTPLVLTTPTGVYAPVEKTGSLINYRVDLAAMSSVTPQMFGAVADGVTDDSAAIQAAWDYAFAHKTPCYHPGGNYGVKTSLLANVNGWNLIGDGWENTRLIPLAAIPLVIVTGLFGKMDGIGGWGASTGTYGLILKNAGGCEFSFSQFREFLTDGVLISPTYGGGSAGNNNCAKFRNFGANGNGACGARMAQHSDNNNIEYLGLEASGNGSHGLIGKSSKYYVSPASIFEGNGGYGILMGEDADSSSNLDSKIDLPWVEGNALGGVRGSASSSNNIVRLFSQGQGYTRHASATNSVEIVTGGGLSWFGSADGVSFIQATGAAADMSLKAASATGGNVNLSIGRAGTGYVALLGRTQIVDDGDTFAEFNIRPAAAKTGAITFTHPGVADRWGIGIKTADSNLYFGNRDLSAPVVTFSSAGAVIATGAVSGASVTATAAVSGTTGVFSSTVTGTSFIVGANQVVGARQTGWAADTGTAKKTANATYAAGTTLTYSAAYVQAEQTAMATRMAAVEAALQDASQTIKALKDERLAAGSIGA